MKSSKFSILLKSAAKAVTITALVFLFSPILLSQAQLLDCYNVPLMSAPAGTQCSTNSRGWIEKQQDGSLLVSNATSKKLWMVPNNGRFDVGEAVQYCISINAHLPEMEEVQALLDEIKNPNTGATQQLFTSSGTYGPSSKNHVWLNTEFSSVMNFLWLLDKNMIHSRYFKDYKFNALCVR